MHKFNFSGSAGHMCYPEKMRGMRMRKVVPAFGVPVSLKARILFSLFKAVAEYLFLYRTHIESRTRTLSARSIPRCI
jgi:hypothetical protein